MQLGEEARWVEIIDEKCLKVGEVLHILQGERGEMLFCFFFLRPGDTLPRPDALSWCGQAQTAAAQPRVPGSVQRAG